MLGVLSSLLLIVVAGHDQMMHRSSSHPTWLVNCPSAFSGLDPPLGRLLDVKNDLANVSLFESFSDVYLDRIVGATDGEEVDAIEHFFWGQRNGLAIELGSLCGSNYSHSVTAGYEVQMGWKRILVEGDPRYRDLMRQRSPQAFSANAAICARHTQVHFINSMYVGGIAEFMSPTFLKRNHPQLYNISVPPGNVSSIDWSQIPYAHLIDCVPLSAILRRAKVKHVNLFILDVEGGELEVLKSIHWSTTRFDVLCVETSPVSRPENYARDVTAFLESKGYRDASGQQGRNIWYVHKDFVPSTRPGLGAYCYNGARKFDFLFPNRGKIATFEKCPLKI